MRNFFRQLKKAYYYIMNDNPLPVVVVLARCYHINGGTAGFLLVNRTRGPKGLALPGGFVDCMESVEEAAVREVREETGLFINKNHLKLQRVVREGNNTLIFLSCSKVIINISRDFKSPETDGFETSYEDKKLVFESHQDIYDHALQGNIIF